MHRATFLILAAMTCLPLMFAPVEHITWIGPIFPLSGSFEEKIPPGFSIGDFFLKKFQSGLSVYADATFPFRAVFIRFRNQIQKSVFHKIHGKKIVEGTDGYYYENDHVAAYLGTDFKDPNGTMLVIRRMKRVQDLLRQSGKTFLVILAPGKARIYPEHIPAGSPAYAEENYYNLLHREMDARGLNFVDSIAFVKDAMQKDPLAFYPRYGTHWSVWGAAHVWQYVVDRTRALSGRPIPRFSFRLAERTMLPRHGTTDSDLFDSMNLMWSLPFGHYLYPAVEAGPGEKLALLAVGDSFYQTFFAFQGPQSIFNPTEFRFYNKIVYPGDGTPSRKVTEAPLSEAIQRADVVMLLVSEVNFKWFGYGFVEEAEEILGSR